MRIGKVITSNEIRQLVMNTFGTTVLNLDCADNYFIKKVDDLGPPMQALLDAFNAYWSQVNIDWGNYRSDATMNHLNVYHGGG